MEDVFQFLLEFLAGALFLRSTPYNAAAGDVGHVANVAFAAGVVALVIGAILRALGSGHVAPTLIGLVCWVVMGLAQLKVWADRPAPARHMGLWDNLEWIPTAGVVALWAGVLAHAEGAGHYVAVSACGFVFVAGLCKLTRWQAS